MPRFADGNLQHHLRIVEHATAASFRKGGSWTVQTEAGAEPFEV